LISGYKYFLLIDEKGSEGIVEDFADRVIHVGSLVGEFFFNFVFAATAATIISGALAERVELVAYLKYCVV